MCEPRFEQVRRPWVTLVYIGGHSRDPAAQRWHQDFYLETLMCGDSPSSPCTRDCVKWTLRVCVCTCMCLWPGTTCISLGILQDHQGVWEFYECKCHYVWICL